MYQVYTQQRPGRPRWALGSSAILLLITVGLAAGLIRMKSRVGDVPLKDFALPGLSGKLPAEWKTIDRKDASLPPGTLAAVQEGDSKDTLGRQLYVYTAPPDSDGLPSRYAAAVANRYATLVMGRLAQALIPGSPTDEESVGPARVAGLPGWAVKRVGLSGSAQGLMPVTCLSVAGIGPGGQIIGAALWIQGTPRVGDRRLLENIAGTLEFVGTRRASDPQAVLKSAGLQLTLPPGAWAYEPSVSGYPRVRLVGAEGEGVWFLDACRVPLIAGRTPAQIVEDCALGELMQPGLPEAVSTAGVNGRTVAELSLPVPSERDRSVWICCTQTDEVTGLLLCGRSESQGREAFEKWARDLAASAKAASFREVVDPEKGIAAGQQAIARVHTELMARMWSAAADEPFAFVQESPGITYAREVGVVTRQERDGKPWWSHRRRVTLIDEEGSGRLVSREDWLVREGGGAFEHDYVRYDRSNRPELSFTERLTAGAERLERSLTIPRGGIRQDAVSVGEAFGMELVLVLAAGELAREPQRGPMIVSTSEVFPKGAVHWVFTPLGKRQVPWTRENETFAAVSLQRDYDNGPIILYYRPDGELQGLEFDSGEWHRRVSDEKGDSAAR